MRWLAVLLVLVVNGCANETPRPSGASGFEGRLLALSDVDMPGSAYADGRLDPIPGAVDTLSLVEPDRGAIAAQPAPNSVLSWPQILATSPDGRFAYVVETRGSPRRGAASIGSVSELPAGSKLTAYEILGAGLRTIAEADAGPNPQSVSPSADGRWLATVNERGGGEVIIFALSDGRPERRFVFPLRLRFEEGDAERFPRSLAWSPAGDWLAVNVALRRIAFFRILRGEHGEPEGIEAHGAPLPVGKRLSRGIWTADGRRYLVPDINAGPSALSRVVGAKGLVAVVAFDESDRAAHRVVARAAVGGSPEGLALSPDERRVATVNLERTFLPERWFLNWLPGRSRYTVDLLDFDRAAGTLTPRDRVAAEGILPEDLVFDPTGRRLAVAVFHRRHGPERRQGFLDFFSIVDGRLVAKGAPVRLPRGAHDVELVR